MMYFTKKVFPLPRVLLSTCNHSKLLAFVVNIVCCSSINFIYEIFISKTWPTYLVVPFVLVVVKYCGPSSINTPSFVCIM